jgi:LacI family transcriptional regulator
LKRKKVNIKDIAEATNLSATTVSRVLNGKAEQYRISEESRKKVLGTVKKLHYIPNQIAVNLQSGRTKTIALIIPSLINPFFARIVSIINAELQRIGYIAFISDSNENCEIEKRGLFEIISRNVEGIIIAPCGDSPENLRLIQQCNIQS